jgi:hypothetical protein
MGKSLCARFVILFEGRTGSSWLVESLDSHPAIRAWGEILDQHVVFRSSIDPATSEMSRSGTEASEPEVRRRNERSGQDQIASQSLCLFLLPAGTAA